MHFPDIDPRWAFEIGNEVRYTGAVFLDKDGSMITLTRNGRELLTGRAGFSGSGFCNTTVPGGAAIKVETESAALDLTLSELDDGGFPGFGGGSGSRVAIRTHRSVWS